MGEMGFACLDRLIQLPLDTWGHLGTANNHVKWWEESGKVSQKGSKFAFAKLCVYDV